MKIENLNFSVRTYNILKRAKIDTVEQLQQFSDVELMRVRNLGRHSLEEIREKLESHTMTNGYYLRAMDDEFLAWALIFYREDWNDYYTPAGYYDSEDEAHEKTVEWLKQPIKENYDGKV